ncbi:MAG: OmpA family protein [Candidatus Andeanibacterium colombiense]|uniref:OmpA family protein n=1 Tax=Candidatus Andeanibacterium colombiense TaxID=3121345 RepID=A0AAJ5XB27_9SPHN|nr:MAG: OmpA family protein [Sphingomonadaceae bacterium]
MTVASKNRGALFLLAALAVPASGLYAQQETSISGPEQIDVYGQRLPDPSQMTKGPVIEGIISARSGDHFQVTTADGSHQTIAVSDATKVRSSGGFLGLSRNKLATDSLLNGLPVSVATLQYDGGLFANQIDLKDKDLKFASMIRNGTDQRFAEQTAATEALRGRMGDIDQYNIKATTNVNFDTGKAALTGDAKGNLCAISNQASGMDNALILVVGYTDSTGTPEINQALSEKRASTVVNYLQQACGWKPYRMLTPTGMATADPLADNSTMEGKAQNRRVAVNVLVSKAVDGI